jgi:hypothetical protein
MFGRGICADRYVIGKRRGREESLGRRKCVLPHPTDGEMDRVTWLIKIMKK